MGLAYLPNGRRIPYEDYLKTKEWRDKKTKRLVFDNWECGICHDNLSSGYETHHINYSRLGNEDIEHDLISLCRKCHETFHNFWEKSDKWESSPYFHWQDYSLKDTAKLCYQYKNEDLILGGDYNLCNGDTVISFIDRYFIDNEITDAIRISEDDVRMCFRNFRYDFYFQAASSDEFDLEKWLDDNYGKKGCAGGNQLRSTARRFFTKHKIGSMKRIYKENANINILMKEIEKYE